MPKNLVCLSFHFHFSFAKKTQRVYIYGMAIQISLTAEIKELNENISYIPATKNPLSSDVVFIKGKNCVWVYDVGACKEAAHEIESVFKKKNVVLSHFHPDHVWNLICTTRSELYVSENTRKYVKQGTVVDGELVFPGQGKFPEVRIFEVPSCHAKGCLGLQCGEYLFLGDATYAQEKFGKKYYNEQILKQLIDCIESIDCQFVCLSHSRSFAHKKEDVLGLLNAIYNSRQKGRSEIFVDGFYYDDELMENEFDDVD